MKTAFVAISTTLIAIQLHGTPLKIVPVTAPDCNCPFSTTRPICTVFVNDSSGTFHLTGATGDAVLLTRTYVGDPGTPLAGLYAYVYRVDLTSTESATRIVGA